jgi:putative copper export protein
MKTIAGAILILAACVLFAGAAMAHPYFRDSLTISLLNWGGGLLLLFGVILLSFGIGMESLSHQNIAARQGPSTAVRVVVMVVSLLVALSIIGLGLILVFRGH